MKYEYYVAHLPVSPVEQIDAFINACASQGGWELVSTTPIVDNNARHEAGATTRIMLFFHRPLK